MKSPINNAHISVSTFAVLFMLLGVLSTMFGCQKQVGPTQVAVEDSVRHYYPMVLGEELNILYVIKNMGEEPLVINDIQPSCGCIVFDEKLDHIVFPGKELRLKFVFDSSKNLGLVEHTIRIYGNIVPKGVVELKFDVNVVPPSENTPDYEETYSQRQREERMSGIKDAVDGKSTEKGYYVDDGNKTDSRTHKKYPWRE